MDISILTKRYSTPVAIKAIGSIVFIVAFIMMVAIPVFALIPQDGSDDVYLYRYQEYDDGTFELMDIDDDAQFHKVAREFDAIMAENEEE